MSHATENIDYLTILSSLILTPWQVAYIKIRVGGKAYNYLLFYLEVERNIERNPTSKEVLKFLENVFKDLDRRIKAR